MKVEKNKIIHIDLDGVVVDLVSEAQKELEQFPERYKTLEEVIDNSDTVFLNAKPIAGAIESIKELMNDYEVYILSTAPWDNVHSWSQKRIWVGTYLPELKRRLILTHNKDFVIGDFLIDDRLKNGVENFRGRHIHFGQKDFPTWKEVMEFFRKK